MAATAATITNQSWGSDRGSRWTRFDVTLTNMDGEYVDLGWSELHSVQADVVGGTTIVHGPVSSTYSAGRLTLKSGIPQGTVSLRVLVKGVD